MAVKQTGVEREDRLRLVRKHNPHVDEALYADRELQFPFWNHELTNELIQHPAEFRQVRIRTKLFRHFIDVGVGDHLVEVAKVIYLVTHKVDTISDPFREWKLAVVIIDDARIPCARETALQAFSLC